MLVLTCERKNGFAVADPAAGRDEAYRAFKQLITTVQARTGCKELTSFPCARLDPYFVYYAYVNKLGKVSFLQRLPCSRKSLFHKGTEFIAHPTT